ncbi:cell division septation protein DedD [Lysobacter niabensis]|uniref:Cell division septation protein DedD n=1 Tax=Agrilutibacter niabensis TaxID=380628 RepID=A0ABU1VTD6_9GAMM|nr:SPOR domain-containing protein [Lysobacter niabensis]MDR7100761.1 cell division septation protein DedD [Lysobacter niabensis]
MLVRALIVLLAVLNLGAAAWWIARDPLPPPAPMQLPPGVARLQLVDEGARTPAPSPAPSSAPSAGIVAAPPPSTTAVASDVAAPPAPQCFSFGPFASKGAGSDAAAKLAPLVQHVATREQAAPASGHGWRVYLPPLPSAEQAQGVAQRIAAAGFNDFFIVREGAEANSIALGRYGGEAAAKKRAEALNAAGIAAQVEALGAPDAASTAVWLDVTADTGFDPRRAQATIAAAQYRKADCALR